MRNIAFIILLLLAVTCGESLAQQNTFLVKKVQLKGLPATEISSFQQDDEGFMWIGTLSGLFRYDGSRVTRFFRDPADSNSLTHNYANSLTKDKMGNIWIGTYGGFMNVYDRRSGKIKRVESAVKSPYRPVVIKTTVSLNQEYILAATTQCIYKITADAIIIDSISLAGTQANITDFLEYEHDKFVITTNSGLLLIDWKTRNVHELKLPSINTRNFRAVEKDDKGNVWIGSVDGLHILTLKNSAIIERKSYDEDFLLRNKSVLCFVKDKTGRMWIGTSEGLFVATDNQFQKVTLSEDHTPANVNCLFIDNTGTVWAGTTNTGLYLLYQPAILFQSIPLMQLYSKKQMIQSLLEEKPGVWLIGTPYGLFKYQFLNHRFEKINLESKRDIWIYCQLKDRNNGWWIGTNGNGLYYQPSPDEEFIHLSHQPDNENSIPSNNVVALAEDKYGKIWIGNFKGGAKINGLCNYEPSTRKITRIKESSVDTTGFHAYDISQIGKDDEHQLWIGTWDRGLYKCKINNPLSQQGSFINYSEKNPFPNKISHQIVSCVKPARNGMIWFGTISAGMNRLDSKTDSITWFSIKDGMPSNLVYRIEEDDQGILWLSTDNGISRFDPDRKTFINYDIGSGLPANNFAFLTSMKCADGTIAFGTSDGHVVYFNPNSFKNSANKQAVVITDIRLSNKSLQVGSASPLKQAANLTDTLRLNYDQNVIGFELANMDFLNPGIYTYAYKLEGFDEDWTYITDKNSITYTNLDPGTYTLLIKNANHLGIWNENPTKLTLIIKPPYWRTWWFVALIILTILAGIYLLFRYRLKQKLKLFAVRNRLHRDLHDDVGATLSSVKAYSEILKDNPDNPIVAELIKENASEMIERLEVIAWATNPQHDNFKSLKNRMQKFSLPLCHSKQIECIIETDSIDDNMMMPGEVRQNIFLVFKEVVNNMIKYAEATKCITKFSVRNNRFILQVTDNGKGFDGDVKGSGSGCNNMRKRTDDLKGALDINSSTGKGTTITMSLPYPFKIPNSWYRNRHSK